MTTAGLILACLAAVIHIYIFYLESVAWTSPKTRAVFGVSSAAEAETTRQLAFSQGFYNLFLAVCVIAGTVVFAAGAKTVGATLVFTGAGSMTAAGLVLLLSSPDKASAALKQLVPPLLGVIVLAVGLW
ncbi:DUF1304 domain-containing protein [Nocardia africana]|uniref:DUF1304 domain-containing protein n=1 Tax=Nocardia africana TaxID=134964 RepID=A0ABW6NNC6_9NOCA